MIGLIAKKVSARQKLIMALAMIGALSACTTSVPTPNPYSSIDYDESLNDFFIRYQKILSDGGVKQPKQPPTIVKGDGFTTGTYYFCLGNIANSIPVKSAPDMQCRRLDGSLDIKGFCRDKKDPFHVFFYATATSEANPACPYAFDQVNKDTPGSRGELVIVPDGNTNNDGYIKELIKHNYETQKMQEAREKADAIAAQERLKRAQLEQAQRAAREAARIKLMSRIGTKICHETNNNVFIGYVENMANDKFQIRVSSAYDKMLPSFALAGFVPNIIWDYPSNWYLCE